MHKNDSLRALPFRFVPVVYFLFLLSKNFSEKPILKQLKRENAIVSYSNGDLWVFESLGKELRCRIFCLFCYYRYMCSLWCECEICQFFWQNRVRPAFIKSELNNCCGSTKSHFCTERKQTHTNETKAL